MVNHLPPILSSDTHIGDLPAYEFTVRPDVPSGQVAWELQCNPLLPGVILKDSDQKLLGVISRSQFLSGLTHSESHEEFLAQPIQSLLEHLTTQVLKLPASTSIDAAAQYVLTREPEHVAEPILVEYPSPDSGGGSDSPPTHRLLAAFTLLRSQTQLLAQANETIRKQKEAVEIASAHKSEFLANVSHEIRTPMNGILGLTELLLDTTQITPEQREYLELVKSSADSLMGVINDLLDFSKIEAGVISMEPETFAIRDALSDAIRPIAARAHRKGINLGCHVWPEVPDLVIGDPARLRQVILNLVNNSVKFTDSGSVTIDAHLESLIDSDVILHFTVTDTGIGIPPEKQQVIFLPYVQADSSTTRKYGGTGLGLAICAKLISAMGGRIWVESEVGHGATFHFTCRFRQAPPANQPSMPRSGLEGLPVLIVDPSTSHRQILSDTLKNWRLRPRAVPPELALSELTTSRSSSKPYPLVIVDASSPPTPTTSGIELATRIASTPTPPGSGGPSAVIVMLAPASSPSDRQRLTSAGVRSIVTTPLKRSELLDAIIRALHLPETANAPSFFSTAPSPCPLPCRPLRVLVAEDHPVNQRLVLAMLEKLGHHPTLVSNGLQALDRLDSNSYDAVLMDVQMPVMSGIEAVRELRHREIQLGRRTPVVAMTAHAMDGDRERCLDAGMDDYVSKPVRPADLTAALKRVTDGSHDDSDLLDDPQTGDLAINAEAILDRCAGDPALLGELVDLFLTEWPLSQLNIHDALRLRDLPRLHMAAHKLRGAVAVFEANTTAELALRLEEAAQSQNWPLATETSKQLDAAVGKLIPALQALARKVRVP